MKPELYLGIILLSCLAAFIASVRINTGKIRRGLSAAVKQDITGDEMRKAEEKVSEFLVRNHLEPGAHISVIGEALNVRVSDREEQISGQAHLSSPDENGIMTVTFRKGLSRQERTFAFAHECGHIINKDALPVDRPNGRNKAYVEQAADYVAAALLMPLDHVYAYLTENNYNGVVPRKRMKIVRRLSRVYGVDYIIALRRIREVYMLKEA